MYHVVLGSLTKWRTQKSIGKRLKDVPFSFPAVLLWMQSWVRKRNFKKMRESEICETTYLSSVEFYNYERYQWEKIIWPTHRVMEDFKWGHSIYSSYASHCFHLWKRQNAPGLKSWLPTLPVYCHLLGFRDTAGELSYISQGMLSYANFTK